MLGRWWQRTSENQLLPAPLQAISCNSGTRRSWKVGTLRQVIVAQPMDFKATCSLLEHHTQDVQCPSSSLKQKRGKFGFPFQCNFLSCFVNVQPAMFCIICRGAKNARE